MQSRASSGGEKQKSYLTPTYLQFHYQKGDSTCLGPRYGLKRWIQVPYFKFSIALSNNFSTSVENVTLCFIDSKPISVISEEEASPPYLSLAHCCVRKGGPLVRNLNLVHCSVRKMPASHAAQNPVRRHPRPSDRASLIEPTRGSNKGWVVLRTEPRPSTTTTTTTTNGENLTHVASTLVSSLFEIITPILHALRLHIFHLSSSSSLSLSLPRDLYPYLSISFPPSAPVAVALNRYLVPARGA
ncbi:hypothetical protein L249_8613, partial [Ophiocordyceps polyrhachis-furcata BCC 54312]